MKNKLIWTGLLMLSLVTTSVHAQDTNLNVVNGNVSFNQGNASILIQANPNQSLVGKSFRVYKLFDATNSKDNSSIHYTLNSVYADKIKAIVSKKLNKQVDDQDVVDYMMSLDVEGNLSAYRYFIEEVQKEISSLDASVVTVDSVDASGNIRLDKLAYGYYLIDEVTNVTNKHAASSLTMVNTANPNASFQIKSDYPEIVKKIYEDDLNVGWNDIGDFEIGQNIPYKYESSVPDMSGYTSYYFGFDDVMDTGLSLKENSLQIKINDTIVDKSLYTLTKTENGFTVQFENLKNVPNVKAGQKIILTYDAYLNENCVTRIGENGFENKVRLSFSNDPQSDSKGQTPWDSVVCYTYQIKGLKTSDKDVKLEGAQFELYRDKVCTDKVDLKKSANGYVLSAGSKDVLSSDTNGSFIILGLDQGTYYLKEIKAPDGYQILKEPVEITITPTFIGDRNNYVSGNSALQDFKATSFEKVLSTSKPDTSVALKVINQTGSKLPITGSAGTLICTVTGAGILFYVFKKKKES